MIEVRMMTVVLFNSAQLCAIYGTLLLNDKMKDKSVNQLRYKAHTEDFHANKRN